MRGAAPGAGCTMCMTFTVPVSGFRASSAVGPAGSRHGSDTPVTDDPPAAPAGNGPQRAQPWLSTCWLASRPISMSSRISSAVSA